MKKKCEVSLEVDVQRALSQFSFIENENITLLARENKGNLYSLCDGVGGKHFCCFWDRHLIEGNILQCPIRKVYKGDQHTYESNINGNTYTISDNLNTTRFYYETDGHFCSAECCMAYLDEEELRNPLYVQSKQLLVAVLGEEPRRAPHWRTLIAYGGTLTLNEFRKTFPNRKYSLEETFSSVFPYCYKFKEAYHL